MKLQKKIVQVVETTTAQKTTKDMSYVTVAKLQPEKNPGKVQRPISQQAQRAHAPRSTNEENAETVRPSLEKQC